MLNDGNVLRNTVYGAATLTHQYRQSIYLQESWAAKAEKETSRERERRRKTEEGKKQYKRRSHPPSPSYP